MVVVELAIGRGGASFGFALEACLLNWLAVDPMSSITDS
jgi:hypothetical protein